VLVETVMIELVFPSFSGAIGISFGDAY